MTWFKVKNPRYTQAEGRRQELLLSKAIDLARARTEMVLRVAEKEGRGALLHDEVILAEGYYQWLIHLLAHGRLPDDPRIKRSTEKRPASAEG